MNDHLLSYPARKHVSEMHKGVALVICLQHHVRYAMSGMHGMLGEVTAFSVVRLDLLAGEESAASLSYWVETSPSPKRVDHSRVYNQ
jgi:hypothetical protein